MPRTRTRTKTKRCQGQGQRQDKKMPRTRTSLQREGKLTLGVCGKHNTKINVMLIECTIDIFSFSTKSHHLPFFQFSRNSHIKWIFVHRNICHNYYFASSTFPFIIRSFFLTFMLIITSHSIHVWSLMNYIFTSILLCGLCGLLLWVFCIVSNWT